MTGVDHTQPTLLGDGLHDARQGSFPHGFILKPDGISCGEHFQTGLEKSFASVVEFGQVKS